MSLFLSKQHACTAVPGCSDNPCPLDLPFQPQPCPLPEAFCMGACQDSVEVDLQEVGLTALGRVIHLNLTLKQICPGKRVAVAVLLTEICSGKGEFSRGMKFFTIPPHHGDGCRDLILRCIPFIVPEPCSASSSLCCKRYFNARVLAHYADTDYLCCSPTDSLCIQ